MVVKITGELQVEMRMLSLITLNGLLDHMLLNNTKFRLLNDYVISSIAAFVKEYVELNYLSQ